MAPPLIPTSLPAGWQTELQPHEWQEAANLARQIIHEETLKGVVPGAPTVNPRLEEAKQTLAMANDALNVYDEAAATGGGERLRSGVVGGVKGAGNLLKNIALAIPRALAGTYNLATNPEETVNRWDQGIQRTMEQLGEAIQHPIRTAENASPETTSEVAMSLASIPLPAARMSTGIGRTRPLATGVAGPLDAMTSRVMSKPTVLETALAPFKRVGGAISSWSRKAEMQNEANRAKALRDVEAAESHRARRTSAERARERQDEMHDVNIESARRRQEILGETFNRQTALRDQLDNRIKLLEDEIERQPNVAKNLELRNELLELQLQRARAAEAAAGEGGAAIDKVISDPSNLFGPEGPAGPSPTPRPRRPRPSKPTVTPATEKPAAATTSVEAPTGSPAAKPTVTPASELPSPPVTPKAKTSPKRTRAPVRSPEAPAPKLATPAEIKVSEAMTNARIAGTGKQVPPQPVNPEVAKIADLKPLLDEVAETAQTSARPDMPTPRSVEMSKGPQGNQFPDFNEDLPIANTKSWPVEPMGNIKRYLQSINENLEGGYGFNRGKQPGNAAPNRFDPTDAGATPEVFGPEGRMGEYGWSTNPQTGRVSMTGGGKHIGFAKDVANAIAILRDLGAK